MLKEFTEKYRDLSDTTLYGVSYSRSLDDDGFVTIVMLSYNYSENHYQKVKLTLSGIKSFRFVEIRDSSNFVINAAAIENRNNEIVLDFFPVIYANRLEINSESDFLVECLELKFEVL